MLSNLVKKNGETISVLLTLKYNGFELKYNQSPTTPPPRGGVWVKGLYPYHRKSVVLKPYGPDPPNHADVIICERSLTLGSFAPVSVACLTAGDSNYSKRVLGRTVGGSRPRGLDDQPGKGQPLESRISSGSGMLFRAIWGPHAVRGWI